MIIVFRIIVPCRMPPFTLTVQNNALATPGGVLSYMSYTGSCRWIGYVFGVSVLNRVYNFKRICPGPVLDREWLQDCRPYIWQSEIRDVSLYLF